MCRTRCLSNTRNTVCNTAVSRTISIRLSTEMIQEIDEKCNTDSCSRNDFIKNAISEALEKKPVSEAKITRISYDDGKTWIDLD